MCVCGVSISFVLPLAFAIEKKTRHAATKHRDFHLTYALRHRPPSSRLSPSSSSSPSPPRTMPPAAARRHDHGCQTRTHARGPGCSNNGAAHAVPIKRSMPWRTCYAVATCSSRPARGGAWRRKRGERREREETIQRERGGGLMIGRQHRCAAVVMALWFRWRL